MHARYLQAVATPEQLPPPTHCEFGFVGRSNCGKSSLINGLLNSKLARTSAMPGRTQMLHYFELQIDPEVSMLLVDLPGYGFNKTPQKTQKTWDVLIQAFLGRGSLQEIFFLHDIRRTLEDVDFALLEDLLEVKKVSLVLTKTDKLSTQEKKKRLEGIRAELGAEFSDLPLYPISNLHKDGIDALRLYMQQQVRDESN